MRRDSFLCCSVYGIGVFSALVLFLISCNPYKEGERYLKEGKYAEAVKFYEEKVKAKPDNSVLRNQLGFSYAKLGKYMEARREYDKAIELNKNYAEAYYNLGTLLMSRPFLLLNDAVKQFDKAIELNPNYAKAYNNRGMTYTYLGDFEKAKKDLETALKLSPDNKVFKDNLEYCSRMEDVNRVLLENREKKEAESQKQSKPK